MSVEDYCIQRVILPCVKQSECLLGGDEFRSERLQFRNGTFPILGLQGFDRIPNDVNSAPALEQTLGCEAERRYSVTTPNTTNSTSGPRRFTSSSAWRLSKMLSVCFSSRICW